MSKRPPPSDSDDSEQDSGDESNVLDSSEEESEEQGEDAVEEGEGDGPSDGEEGTGSEGPGSPANKHKRARANSTDARFALPADHETSILREKIVLDAHPGAEDDARQLLVLEVSRYWDW